MTVLSVFQGAVRRLLGQNPNTLFSAQDPLQIKMQEIIQEAALDLSQRHDWRVLTRLCTLTADGNTEDFPLPADYGRMLLKGDVHSSQWLLTYQAANDMDEWLNLKRFMPAQVPGYWALYGGQIHIIPPPPSGEQPAFGYITKNIATGADGKPKLTFDTDTDTFALDENLLKMSVIWRWKQAEGLDYSEDMQNCELLFSQLAAKDKGSKVIRSSRIRPTGMGIWGIPG